MPFLPSLSWILIILACGQLLLAIGVWRQVHVPGLRAFAGVMTSVGFYVFCYALQLAPALKDYAPLLKNLEFVGIVLLAPFTVLFYSQYTEKDRWLTKPVVVALFAFAFINLAVKWSDPWFHLVHKEYWLESSGSINLHHIVRGPWYLVINTYTFLSVAIGFACIVATWPTANSIHRRHLGALSVPMLLPMATHLWRLSPLNPWPGFDPVPIAFILSMAVVFWTIWRNRLTRIAPVARDLLFEMYPGAIVVTDIRRNIVDSNPAARKLLASFPGSGIGCRLEHVLELWPELIELCRSENRARREIVRSNEETQYFEVVWHPLQADGGQLRGFLLLANDISERKQNERKLQELLANRTRDWHRATAAALKAGEDEADRIGRELHDMFCPELIGASRKIKAIADELNSLPEVANRLQNAAESTGTLARQARNLSHLLARPNLAFTSFSEYLEAQLSQIEQALGIRCELAIDEHFPVLDSERASHLIKIVREAVINASRHAGAQCVWIDCLHKHGTMEINISSDGLPFSNPTQIKEGLGLRQMRMRANLLGASFSIEPGPNGPAIVRLKLG